MGSVNVYTDTTLSLLLGYHSLLVYQEKLRIFSFPGE